MAQLRMGRAQRRGAGFRANGANGNLYPLALDLVLAWPWAPQGMKRSHKFLKLTEGCLASLDPAETKCAI